MSFPWRDLALWLREGAMGAFMLNKLMVASDKKSSFQGQLGNVFPEEVALLHKVLHTVQEKKLLPQDHQKVVEEIARTLKSGSPYPIIEKEQIQSMWRAFMAYGINNARYDALKTPLIESFGEDPLKLGHPVTALMDRVWRSLGPGTVLDQHMIEGKPSGQPPRN